MVVTLPSLITGGQSFHVCKDVLQKGGVQEFGSLVPFWDFERARWFAGCLCWSNDAYRLLSASVDLAYFKIFSHSIMRELSRLDAVALNQAGTMRRRI